jgi:hypothetical protein
LHPRHSEWSPATHPHVELGAAHVNGWHVLDTLLQKWSLEQSWASTLQAAPVSACTHTPARHATGCPQSAVVAQALPSTPRGAHAPDPAHRSGHAQTVALVQGLPKGVGTTQAPHALPVPTAQALDAH